LDDIYHRAAGARKERKYNITNIVDEKQLYAPYGRAIVAVLTVARERRREKLVMEQKAKVSKVLLEGLYEDPSDPDYSLLSVVRGPRELVMKKIWEYCTSEWQVYTEAPANGMSKLSIRKRRCTT